jgi:hypothetical protein
MSKDEALKLALEDLIYASSYCDTYDAIDAVRQALAEPVQEPAAYLTVFRSLSGDRNTKFLELSPLPDGEYYFYTTPPAAPVQEPDVLYKTAAQYPKRPYQVHGFDWLSPKTRTITVKSGVHVEITWDIEKKNCDVVLSPAQPATEDSSEVAAPAQTVQTAQEPVLEVVNGQKCLAVYAGERSNK